MKIEKITPVNCKNNLAKQKNEIFKNYNQQSINFSNISTQNNIIKQNINSLYLIERGILGKNENLEDFFKKISQTFFLNPQEQKDFTKLLNEGCIAFSTSAYKGIVNSKKPYSAIGLSLNPSDNIAKNLLVLEEHIKNEEGVGINFSNFDDPIKIIREINSYFLFRQKKGNVKRPPAGIALLSIYHPKIIDFIQLKNEENYNDWCFDLSVVIPDDFLKKADGNEYITTTNGINISAKEIYLTLINSMLKKGEPGIIFSNNKDYICDCCAAAPLKANEGLTLAHINLSKFYNFNDGIDYKKLEKAASLISKAMSKLDNNGYIGILGYQELLNLFKLNYGSIQANELLENVLKTIKKEVQKNNIKMTISPTGTTSRILNTTPAIEPLAKNKTDYTKKLMVLQTAQKYLDGNISTTIRLDKNASPKDIDTIIRKAKEYNLKGITVFKKQ